MAAILDKITNEKRRSKDYIEYHIRNKPKNADGSSGFTEMLGEENELIIEAFYSSRDKSLLIEHIFKKCDRCAYLDCEIYISDLVYGLLVRATQDEIDRAKSSKSKDQEFKVELDGVGFHFLVGPTDQASVDAAIEWNLEKVVKAGELKNINEDTGDYKLMFRVDRYSEDEEERNLFALLLGSPVVRWVERMLSDYRGVFRGKRIVSVWVHYHHAELDSYYRDIYVQIAHGPENIAQVDEDLMDLA